MGSLLVNLEHKSGNLKHREGKNAPAQVVSYGGQPSSRKQGPVVGEEAELLNWPVARSVSV